MTRELPWSEFARNSSMPAIVLTTASIGLVSCVSISSALAPASRVFTTTMG